MFVGLFGALPVRLATVLLVLADVVPLTGVLFYAVTPSGRPSRPATLLLLTITVIVTVVLMIVAPSMVLTILLPGAANSAVLLAYIASIMLTIPSGVVWFQAFPITFLLHVFDGALFEFVKEGGYGQLEGERFSLVRVSFPGEGCFLDDLFNKSCQKQPFRLVDAWV